MTTTIQPAPLDVALAKKKRVKRRPKPVVDSSAPVEYGVGVDATGARTWTLRFPAPDKMLSVNGNPHWRVTSPIRKTWREAMYVHAIAAKLPKGLTRVRIDVDLRFPTAAKHDGANYHANVIKPCVDALGPEIRNMRQGKAVHGAGYGLIPDDTSEYLDGPFPRVGPKVDDPKRCPFGEVVVTITDLSGVAA